MFKLIITVAAIALQCGIAHADSYPSRPVRIVVPYSAGGGTDIFARVLAERLGDIWKQPVIVDNRPGASTMIGTSAVAKSPADGYTLLLTSTPLVTNPALMGAKIPYDTKRDLAPISLLFTVPLIVTVGKSFPASTMEEFVAVARNKPGQLNYGSAGPASSSQLASELLNMVAGIKTNHIPYKGNSPALVDFMAGHIDFVLMGSSSIIPLLQRGQAKALAVTGSARMKELPNVPTMEEAGWADFRAVTWAGLLGPGQLKPEVVKKISTDVALAMQSAEVHKRLESDGAQAAGNTPAEFQRFIESETRRWDKVIKAANIKLEE